MKKRLVSKLLALTLAVSMLGSLAACGNSSSSGGDTTDKSQESAAKEEDAGSASEADAGAGEEETDTGTDTAAAPAFEERVALDVVAFVSDGEADGLRTDPVSKYIEDSLNIDLYLTHVTEADWPTQLSAMMADNDLPDIFMLSDPTKQLPMLLEANSVLNLSPYLEQYAPNTTSDPAGELMIAANTTTANSPDGNLYLWGNVQGILGLTVPYPPADIMSDGICIRKRAIPSLRTLTRICWMSCRPWWIWSLRRLTVRRPTESEAGLETDRTGASGSSSMAWRRRRAQA